MGSSSSNNQQGVPLVEKLPTSLVSSKLNSNSPYLSTESTDASAQHYSQNKKNLFKSTNNDHKNENRNAVEISNAAIQKNFHSLQPSLPALASSCSRVPLELPTNQVKEGRNEIKPTVSIVISSIRQKISTVGIPSLSKRCVCNEEPYGLMVNQITYQYN